VAPPSRSLHPRGLPRVGGSTPQHAQGGLGLGAQGDGRGPLGVPLRRGRPQVLPPLVLLGDALALDAHDREGADAQDAPPEHPHLPLPPDHQRDRRGPEFEDPVDPVHRPRLPQPGELQDRDLLPLRRPRPLPTLKPEEPVFTRPCRDYGPGGRRVSLPPSFLVGVDDSFSAPPAGGRRSGKPCAPRRPASRCWLRPVDVLRPLGRLVVEAAPGSLQRALICRSSWTERTPGAERAATAADTRSCSARTVPVSRATPFFTSTLI